MYYACTRTCVVEFAHTNQLWLWHVLQSIRRQNVNDDAYVHRVCLLEYLCTAQHSGSKRPTDQTDRISRSSNWSCMHTDDGGAWKRAYRTRSAIIDTYRTRTRLHLSLAPRRASHPVRGRRLGACLNCNLHRSAGVARRRRSCGTGAQRITFCN